MSTAVKTSSVGRDEGPWPDLAATLESQSRWAAQALALQTAWWASWWALQGEWLTRAWDAQETWPAWMVWHNGTEQLA